MRSRTGYAVTRAHADARASGVTLRGRVGLRRILSDVVSGEGDRETAPALNASRLSALGTCQRARERRFGDLDLNDELCFCGLIKISVGFAGSAGASLADHSGLAR